MKYVFSRSRGEDESFAGLMRDLCLSLRVSLSKKRRLVAESEAVGEVEGTGCVSYHWEFGKGDIENGDRVSLSKKRRLVAESEAVGEVEGAVKCLEHMRVIVARDAVTLGELETLLDVRRLR
nr:hypothetical protein [Tanacetum cinerariifolium]